ncbi:hypothetical protein [Aeromonas caviae]|uniref:hypothetical protein n=1 Tax=Aeromonas caviae TaxID=648 RepID=UPI001112F677|nr:hypothetical protein [Aeromonas caviae]
MTPFTAKLTVANIQGRECLALINSGVKKSNGDACSRYADSAIEYLKVSKQFEAVINSDAFLNAQILNEPREGANKSYGTRAFTGNPLILND